MNKERWIGLGVILVLIGGLLVVKAKQTPKKLDEKGLTGEGVEIEEKASELAKRMGVVFPDDVEKTDLKDVTGGTGTGLATRKWAGGTFTHSVLAGLTDPEKGSWYESWLVGEEPSDFIYTGKLRMAKGGWVLDYTSKTDLTDHRKVMVTLEKVDDRKPETKILEGSF